MSTGHRACSISSGSRGPGQPDRAIKLNPITGPTYFNKSLCTVLSGDSESGWPLTSGERGRGEPHAPVSTAVWLGRRTSLNKTLFSCRQGTGDTIEFCRYAMLAQERGANLVLASSPLTSYRALGPTVSGIVATRLRCGPFRLSGGADQLIRALRNGSSRLLAALSPRSEARRSRVASWIGANGSGRHLLAREPADEVDIGRSLPLRMFGAWPRPGCASHQPAEGTRWAVVQDRMTFRSEAPLHSTRGRTPSRQRRGDDPSTLVITCLPPWRISPGRSAVRCGSH